MRPSYIKNSLNARISVFESPLTLSSAYKQAVFGSTKDPTCFYCGCGLTAANFEADHYNPINNGGAHNFDNLRASCMTCNRRKRASLPDDVKTSCGPPTERHPPLLGGLTSRFVREVSVGTIATAFVFRGWCPDVVALSKRLDGASFVVLRKGYRAILSNTPGNEAEIRRFFESLNAIPILS